MQNEPTPGGVQVKTTASADMCLKVRNQAEGEFAEWKSIPTPSAMLMNVAKWVEDGQLGAIMVRVKLEVSAYLPVNAKPSLNPPPSGVEWNPMWDQNGKTSFNPEETFKGNGDSVSISEPGPAQAEQVRCFRHRRGYAACDRVRYAGERGKCVHAGGLVMGDASTSLAEAEDLVAHGRWIEVPDAPASPPVTAEKKPEEKQPIQWPEDLTTLVGKWIVTKMIDPGQPPGGPLNFLVGCARSGDQLVPVGTDISRAAYIHARHLLSVSDSPQSNPERPKDWLPDGMFEYYDGNAIRCDVVRQRDAQWRSAYSTLEAKCRKLDKALQEIELQTTEKSIGALACEALRETP